MLTYTPVNRYSKNRETPPRLASFLTTITLMQESDNNPNSGERRLSLTGRLAVYFSRTEKTRDDTVVNAEDALAELSEAHEFFAGSLKVADAFRLVSNRVKDVMPYDAVVLYLLDDRRRNLLASYSDGVEVGQDDGGLATQCYATGGVEIDSYLVMDSTQAFESSAAIPLRNGDAIFAVLQLYFAGEFKAANNEKYLFEAVGERVAPMILSSLTYERTHTTALTDITTDLPNERAFFLMLEQQIAESHANDDGDPLTVLAIDIRNFEEINEKFGHAVGDRVLNFVAQIAKGNLRQMDFLARSLNDEFLAILPTASIETRGEIVERIQAAFRMRRFDLDETESIEIGLNIGWATYDNEGTTPGELLSFAELKKEEQKIPFGENVVAFPQELVN